MPSNLNLPKVTLIALGGTIAMTARPTDPRTEGVGGTPANTAAVAMGAMGTPTMPTGVAPSLDVQALVRAVPALQDVADLTTVQFRQLPGAHLKISDLIELAGEITHHIDRGAAGVVVTQGTDTIEECAFALDLLVDRTAPVVVTGAMRNPTLPGADGPANLLASVRVAASREAIGLGTVVVFNDEIHAARFVQKTHTTSTAAFRSPSVGPLGWTIEDRVTIAVRLAHPTIARATRTDDAHDHSGQHISISSLVDQDHAGVDHPVALLTAGLGDDGRLLGAIQELGYQGLVVEAFGAGHLPDTWVDRLEQLARRIPVVLASRTGSGEMLLNTYAFRGSESDLLSRGLISAGVLSGPKARILLSLLLHTTSSRDEIERYLSQLIIRQT
jgi:L-asparaginase